jgi:hypothetical protein
MRNIILHWFIFLTICLNCGVAIAGGPWKGKIIDVETKESLEGAVVLAVWDRVYRTPYGSSSYFYEAKETLTNKAGEFEIPSYIPINLLPIISYMRGPEFTIFKPGYGSVNRLALGGYFACEAQEIQDFEIEGKRYRFTQGVIELPMLKTREERRKGQPSPEGDKKDWKKQRELIKALRQEWEYLTGEPAGDLYKNKGGR